MARKLYAVPPPEVEEPPVVDLYVNWRAEIAARDWGAMHVAADKRRKQAAPDLRDQPKRTWSR